MNGSGLPCKPPGCYKTSEARVLRITAFVVRSAVVVSAALLLAIHLAIHAPAQSDGPLRVTPHPSEKKPEVLLGGSIRQPHVTYAPDPGYSEEGRKTKAHGTVVLSLVVGPDGRPRDIKVVRWLGAGLDEKAVDTVKEWKFEPAMKGGKPVAVQIMVEINFHLVFSRVGKVEVVDDPPGVNLDSYLTAVILDLEKQWSQSTDGDAHEPTIKQGQVTMQFAIRRDGRVKDVEVISTSRDRMLDQEALDSVAALKQVKPLPAELKRKELVVRVQLLYNMEGAVIWPDSTLVAIAATKQFYVEVAGIVNPAASWSVSGLGCAGAACGTISADGLYTAPDVLPDPPFVQVKGTLAGVNPITASAAVTLTKAH
jgi:TonB family protein